MDGQTGDRTTLSTTMTNIKRAREETTLLDIGKYISVE